MQVRKEILSLIGKLAHAAKIIIVPGRIFLKCMIEMAMKVKKLDHWVHLSSNFRSDLAWWHCFIESWNGLSMMRSVAAEWTSQHTSILDS